MEADIIGERLVAEFRALFRAAAGVGDPWWTEMVREMKQEAATRERKAAEAGPPVEFDGRRTFTIAGRQFTAPIPLYAGTWKEGRTYTPGDMATSGGSLWHCNRTTTAKPGDGDDWTLAVKRGRDARSRVN